MATNKYNKLAYTAYCLANDMKHIHTHAIGKKFDRIHNLGMDYYDKFSEDADDFTELALEYGEMVMNPSYAAREAGWTPVNMKVYEYEAAMQAMYDGMKQYIDLLETARSIGNDTDVESLIDDKLRYWKKECNYKMNARMAD